MTKTELRQSVLDELDYEPSIDAAHIGVAAEGGVVTLTGHVMTYPQKVAAVQAARRVNGVYGVADEIEVRLSGGKQEADDQIAKRAVDLLRWDSAIPTDAVKVTVGKGLVTLTGQVQWQYQRQLAETAIWKLSGVVGVSNSITIKPPVASASAIDVKARIESALKRRAELEAKSISVTVTDAGRVTLTGKVDNWEERAAVENAVWSAAGVQTVEDNLKIG